MLRLPPHAHDTLPKEAEYLHQNMLKVRNLFKTHGFEPVVTPPMEFEQVMTRGLLSLEGREPFRVLDPQSGEVLVLRPDFTAQIARLVSMHTQNWPRPIRLQYHGRVLRREGTHEGPRDLLQSGIEMIGIHDRWADLEVLYLAAECAELLTENPVLSLGHVGCLEALADSLLVLPEVQNALAKRDQKLIETLCPNVLPLMKYCGETDRLNEALKELPKVCHPALLELQYLINQLQIHFPKLELRIDLLEPCRADFYSGFYVSAWTKQSHKPLLVGGRYDRILKRYGLNEPARGFAIDLNECLYRPRQDKTALPIILTGKNPASLTFSDKAKELRSRGIQVLIAEQREIEKFAQFNNAEKIFELIENTNNQGEEWKEHTKQ